MKKILTSLMAILAIANLDAQQRIPKLVVCITVDQLNGEYMDYFYNTFGEDGFKRLMNEGVTFSNMGFAFSNIDKASAFATLFTGADPCYNGIESAKRFDWDKGRETSVLEDPDYLGNYTQDHFSPKRLLASTIGDELKAASAGKSEVVAIAPDAEEAILSAGHAANCAYWIDNINGKWATTTYYKDLPWYVDHYNNGPESLTARISKMAWIPSLPVDRFNAFPYQMESLPFKYTFNTKDEDCYPDLKTSALVNEEVNRLAMQFINYAGFGTRSCPDLLAITYYAGHFKLRAKDDYTLEIQDTYCRLDRCIEQLLTALDRKVGLANTLVVFTGTGYRSTEEAQQVGGMPLAGGDFYPKRCTALLNMYLMQVYGQKSWVKGYYDGQIFLDRKVIEDAGLSLAEVEAKAAAFVGEFAGVQAVVTDHDLRTGNWYAGNARLFTGTHPQGRGDLIIELRPGWRVNNEIRGEQPELQYNQAVLTPLIFMGDGLKPRHIYREVKATEVAPTVTHILRIRPPNASSALPIEELR